MTKNDLILMSILALWGKYIWDDISHEVAYNPDALTGHGYTTNNRNYPNQTSTILSFDSLVEQIRLDIAKALTLNDKVYIYLCPDNAQLEIMLKDNYIDEVINDDLWTEFTDYLVIYKD